MKIYRWPSFPTYALALGQRNTSPALCRTLARKNKIGQIKKAELARQSERALLDSLATRKADIAGGPECNDGETGLAARHERHPEARHAHGELQVVLGLSNRSHAAKEAFAP